MPLALTYTKIGSTSWRADWSAAAATGPFVPYNVDTSRVIEDEVGLAETTNEFVDIENWTDAYEPPAVEVIDTDTETVNADSQTEKYSSRANLIWRGNPDAAYWVVYQYDTDAAEWVVLRSFTETERGYYSYTTDVLADVTTHQFKVIPYDVLDIAGAPVYFQFFMVRNPSPPRISASYSAATGNVTISARA